MKSRLAFVFVALFAFNLFAAETIDTEIAGRLERDKKTYEAGIEITKTYAPATEAKYWEAFLSNQPDHIYAPNIKKRLAELKPGTPLVPPPITSAPAEKADVRGFMLGAGVGDLIGDTGVVGGVRYWHDYVGADFTLSVAKTKFTALSTDVIHLTTVAFGPALLAGIPFGPIKPHVRLAFLYAYAKNSAGLLTTKELDLVPSLGIDFAPVKHLLIGLDLFSVIVPVWGRIDDAGVQYGFDGYSLGFLNGIRVAWIF